MSDCRTACSTSLSKMASSSTTATMRSMMRRSADAVAARPANPASSRNAALTRTSAFARGRSRSVASTRVRLLAACRSRDRRRRRVARRCRCRRTPRATRARLAGLGQRLRESLRRAFFRLAHGSQRLGAGDCELQIGVDDFDLRALDAAPSTRLSYTADRLRIKSSARSPAPPARKAARLAHVRTSVSLMMW